MPFLDIYMPDEIGGYGWVSAPRTKTTIQVTAGGNERRNQEWEHPLHRFVNPEIISRPDQQSLIDLKKHWLVMRGPYYSFPLSDPHDKATIDHVPNAIDDDIAVTSIDQALGTGDGFTTQFQMVKRYTRGGQNYDRDIHLPVLSTVLIANDGVLVDSADYSVSRPGGIVTFDVPPGSGDVLTWGGLFDVEVRFESDDQLEQIMRTWQAAGASDITLIEVRPC
jgi:uncharacterized protein (TIGR02217 family)